MNRTIPPQRITFTEEDRAEILQRIDACLTSGSVAQGENVKEFEAAFAHQTGAKHAIALSSGGAALEAAMHVLEVRGKEVLVPTNTYFATAAAVLFAGGEVRLVDVSRETFSVSLAALKAARGPETAGVIVVHVGGIVTPEIEAIRDWCDTSGLWLVEDCAHAHGSAWQGRSAGRFGVMGAYSFFATKVVTSGEGGMLITDDDEMAARVRSFRNYGKEKEWTPLSAHMGGNRRMSEFNAAVGTVHLKRLPEFIAWRASVAMTYTALLEAVPDAEPVLPSSPTSWYKYIVLLPRNVDRDRLKETMAARGVHLAGGVYDLPLHQQPVLQGVTGDFPATDEVCSRHICLPIYFGLSPSDAEYVIDILRVALAEVDWNDRQSPKEIETAA